MKAAAAKSACAQAWVTGLHMRWLTHLVGAPEVPGRLAAPPWWPLVKVPPDSSQLAASGGIDFPLIQHLL